MIKAMTKYGEIRGKEKDGYLIFRGVPYARPPVGELRFRPPQEPEPWEGVLDCTSFGPPALQLFSMNHVPQEQILEISSEDCLYLNINTPAFKRCGSHGVDIMPDSGAKLPVYIFIHGGAYETGGGNMPLYHGENFVKNGIIYVNINYRMNIFGFLALEEFRKESGTTGNFGVLDALQAVRWVHENIEAFGGDSENITLGGESAGAFTTSILMGMKQAKGLFRRCILESGAVLGLAPVALYGKGSPRVYRELSAQIAADVGASDTPEGAAVLRRLPAEELIRAWFFKNDGTRRGMRSDPILSDLLFDGDRIPDPRNDYMNDVDLLFGFNSDEGTIFADPSITPEGYLAYLQTVCPKHAQQIYEKYRPDDEHTAFSRLADLIGMTAFKGCMVPYADRLSDRGSSVYGYHFAYMTERLKAEGLGCRHIAELPFVFRKDLHIVGANDMRGRRIAELMSSAWCNFIKTGDPGFGWPRYDKKNKMMMRFDENPCSEKLERADEIEFLNRLILFNE